MNEISSLLEPNFLSKTIFFIRRGRTFKDLSVILLKDEHPIRNNTISNGAPEKLIPFCHQKRPMFERRTVFTFQCDFKLSIHLEMLVSRTPIVSKMYTCSIRYTLILSSSEMGVQFGFTIFARLRGASILIW